jgi:hypothetical protein
MAPNPGYVIETAGSGTEGLMCLATDDDVSMQLPASLGGAPFTPLQGIMGLKDIVKGYTQALGSDAFSHATMEWRVASRRSLRDGQSKSP